MDQYVAARTIIYENSFQRGRERERKTDGERGRASELNAHTSNKYETKRDCAEPDTISRKRNYLRPYPVQATSYPRYMPPPTPLSLFLSSSLLITSSAYPFHNSGQVAQILAQ